ncbi:MAG: lysophospholipid acyltransferase family protein [Synechocystis sp.]|nr:lysophospholipid acyltransferase family protein [Synechocystis sp.]
MKRVLKQGVVLATKLIAHLLLGLEIRHRERLPQAGPAILVANHNSHLDALVLMSLFPLAIAPQLRPVANADYFLHQNPCLAWFARQVLDIIPVVTADSAQKSPDPGNHRAFLQQCAEALAQGQMIILFPEGSRGKPEQLSPLQCGIAHLAKRHPAVPIIPITLTNLGKALPKGDPLLVPFVCGGVVGEPLVWNGDKSEFLNTLTAAFQN